MSPPWELDPVASCSDERSESIMITTHQRVRVRFLVFSCSPGSSLSPGLCSGCVVSAQGYTTCCWFCVSQVCEYSRSRRCIEQERRRRPGRDQIIIAAERIRKKGVREDGASEGVWVWRCPLQAAVAAAPARIRRPTCREMPAIECTPRCRSRRSGGQKSYTAIQPAVPSFPFSFCSFISMACSEHAPTCSTTTLIL